MRSVERGMQGRWRTIMALMLATGAFVVGIGCSLALDWDYNRLPCDSRDGVTDSPRCHDGIDNDGDGLIDEDDIGCRTGCLEGYSCRYNECLLHGYLKERETCTLHVQCAEDLVCSTSHWCVRTCQAPYDSAIPCSEATEPSYCAPSPEGGELGWCLPSECSQDSNCSTGKSCVAMFYGANACYTKCAYSVTITGGVYTDDATTDVGCNPIGEEGTLVQWPLGKGQVGESCHLTNAPCDKGLVCIDPTKSGARCHALCSCESTESCSCSECLDATTYRYCRLP